MSHRTEVLLNRERMQVTLPILIEYYAMSKQVKGCSKKTLCQRQLEMLMATIRNGHAKF